MPQEREASFACIAKLGPERKRFCQKFFDAYNECRAQWFSDRRARWREAAREREAAVMDRITSFLPSSWRDGGAEDGGVEDGTGADEHTNATTTATTEEE